MSPQTKNQNRESNNVLVVGLGASAGGLDPLRKFFKSLPANAEMAFIVVQHLLHDKESSLSDILQRETELEVRQVEKKTLIQKNHVYVIPPNKLLSVENNHLELSEPEKVHGLASIDVLFRTLATKKKKYAAGVLFSGTGSDGITGMKIIKEKGGMTIAQDPDEAQHSSMPLNAIKTGVVDKVLSVSDMAEELRKYHESLSDVNLPEIEDGVDSEDETGDILAQILDRIESRNDHDFSNYRQSSILRRIDRRMRLNRVTTLSDYLDYIEKTPEEADELQKDLLISVTNFFRNIAVFNYLENNTIPKLFEDCDRNQQIRVWVPGCATGEEAYTLAILLEEYRSKLDIKPEIQIFATDVDKDALEKARKGRYSRSIEDEVSSKRLNRFFIKNQDEYVVKNELKDIILFASHNLLRNPPFSKLDLISCRNLLIYLNRDLQSEVFNLFNYSLRENGYLLLGKSDGNIVAEELFDSVAKKYRIYQKKDHIHSRDQLPVLPLLYKTRSSSDFKKTSMQKKENLEKMHWSLLANLYAPESVLISEDYDVLHSTDGINTYLEYSGGEPSRNILDMVKPEIRQELRNILFRLRNEDSSSIKKIVRMEKGQLKLELIARNFLENKSSKSLIHILFKEIKVEPDKGSGDGKKPGEYKIRTGGESEIIEALENELEYTRQQLQLSEEEYVTSNEELRAANEELQSINEELQSSTEELETSKEELQSVNEELKTVNDQLNAKVDELNRTNSDLENLMEATEVGIVFVNQDYAIQRFTSTATEIFNLISSDKGRPLQHITHSLEYDDLLADIGDVLENSGNIKKVVSTKDGRWFIVRMRPYQSYDDKMKGAVLSFTEFTELKEARMVIESQKFQSTLADFGVYALKHDDLSVVMDYAIEKCCSVLNLETIVILMHDNKVDSFNVVAEKGCECLDTTLENSKKWGLGSALKSIEPIVVEDFDSEERFERTSLEAKEEFTSSVYLSLRGAKTDYGVFAVHTKEKREFSKQELNFLQVVTNILGRTIEQGKNREVLRESNSQLQKEIKRSEKLQKEIINSSVQERWELGGYLHDSLGQLLATVKILADDIRLKTTDIGTDLTEEVGEINNIIDSCLKSVRDVTHSIIPIDIENEGVVQAFRFLIRQIGKLHDSNCKLEINNKVLNEIKNREAATHLYHIVQEASKNAAIHGKADTVVVSVDKKDDTFILQIKDDGIGQKEGRNIEGKGIRIMRHRIGLLGGTFNIKDYSDDKKSGAVVTCTVPMAKLKQPGDVK